MGQHLYLEPWGNEEVESMFLETEFILLVRQTYTHVRADTHRHRHTLHLEWKR